MKRLIPLAALFIAPLALALQVATPIAAQASTSSCTPHADGPVVAGGQGAAHGYTTGCSGSDTLTYEVRLSTSNGTVLVSSGVISGAHGNIDAWAPLLGGTVNCSGQQVRSFIWINVNGTVKSSQTGLVSC